MEINRQKAIAATLIIIGSLATLGFKIWADDQTLNVDRPEIIRNGPGHSLSVLIGDRLFSLRRDGSTRKIIDFTAHGIQPVGDIAYFSNGDMLIYIETNKQFWIESIARFLHLQKTGRQASTGDIGLYRCNANAGNCRLFSNQLPVFRDSFHACIDNRDDTVYLADTSGFALYKLDRNGQELGRKTDGLWRPNQIMLHDDLLYVANTNRHAISVLRTDNGHFGEELERHPVTTADGSHRWPAGLIRVKNQWWISVFDLNIEHGQIQRFNDDWQYLDVLPLNRQIDVSTMAAFANSVFIGDWNKIAIYRFDPNNHRLVDFHNPQIDAVLARARHQVRVYRICSWAGLLAFALVFVAGTVAAFIIDKKVRQTQIRYRDDFDPALIENPPTPPGNDVYWIASRHSRKKSFYRSLFGALIIVALFASGWLLANLKTWNASLLLWLAVNHVLFIAIYWNEYRASRYRIGVFKEQLLIDNGHGKIVTGKRADIKRRNTTVLIIKDEVVLLGQPGKRIFPEQELNQWVLPLMLKGQETGALGYFRILWQQRHPSIFLWFVIIVMALVAPWIEW